MVPLDTLSDCLSLSPIFTNFDLKWSVTCTAAQTPELLIWVWYKLMLIFRLLAAVCTADSWRCSLFVGLSVGMVVFFYQIDGSTTYFLLFEHPLQIILWIISWTTFWTILRTISVTILETFLETALGTIMVSISDQSVYRQSVGIVVSRLEFY